MTPIEILSILGLFGGIATTIFLLGYNWRRVTVLEQRIDNIDIYRREHDIWTEKQSELIDDKFVRKDNYDLEITALKSRLDYYYKILINNNKLY